MGEASLLKRRINMRLSILVRTVIAATIVIIIRGLEAGVL